MNIEVITDFKSFERVQEQILELDNAFFPIPWNLDTWKNFCITAPHFTVFTVEENDSSEIIGFALFSEDTFCEQAHLVKVLISPNYRQHGVASSFLKHIFENYRMKGFLNCYLEVSTKNHPALSLYKSLGFEELVRKRKFYSNGEDAYAMQLVF